MDARRPITEDTYYPFFRTLIEQRTLALGRSAMVTCSWFLVPGSWFLAPAMCLLDGGTEERRNGGTEERRNGGTKERRYTA